ncbi:type I-E CRISPR-associated protein Cas5/CasD [Ligilactobacillus agilis]|uniref:type I-E CRISPR-associated protein Cas5/CasD n=1 Tax=Ligilactobacillus agilis TaxID=1601 RepID=UPI00195BD4F6|nr:type I-E CRISPR-associated protein Cas5/CasD [Ligilactobacillus agilis]MBM6764013.1 type I-E CRISPR-associated protein Cas5/CasD [Ligilactobacillus agilis]
MKVITIRLTAPFQFYGNQASFNVRSTNLFPTKSAIVGMVAAALGYRREDTRISSLNDLAFAVRIDQVGSTTTDFQIAKYDAKKPGKLTYRDNLQDYVYVVALGGEDIDLIDKINFTLHHPKFQLFLGRRSNPPAGVLRTETFEATTPIEVLKDKLPWQASKWYQKKYSAPNFEAELYADANLLPGNPNFMMQDIAESFNPRNRRFSYRSVAKARVTLVNPQSHEHDVWEAM